MLKTVLTLFRGRTHTAAEQFVDANALEILKQQIRDAAASIRVSRKAVAVAMASHEQEIAHHKRITAQIKDLEARAGEALKANKEQLALEAAEAIAVLEDESAASQKAQDRFNADIGRLKSQIRQAQSQLRDLQRGERLATATERTQKLHCVSPLHTDNSLQEAHNTLQRLETRQQNVDLARKAEQELQFEKTPTDIAERMAAEGLGKPLKSSADAVLERLRAQAEKTTTKTNRKKTK